MATGRMMMALVMLEEDQSDEDKKTEVARELQLIQTLQNGYRVTFMILTVSQVVLSLVFFWRSRRIKEVTWIPKLIMVLTSVECVSYST